MSLRYVLSLHPHHLTSHFQAISIVLLNIAISQLYLGRQRILFLINLIIPIQRVSERVHSYPELLHISCGLLNELVTEHIERDSARAYIQRNSFFLVAVNI